MVGAELRVVVVRKKGVASWGLLVDQRQTHGARHGQTLQARLASQTHYDVIEMMRVPGAARLTPSVSTPSAPGAATLLRWLCPTASKHYYRHTLHRPHVAQKTKQKEPRPEKEESRPPRAQTPATGCASSFWTIQESQSLTRTPKQTSTSLVLTKHFFKMLQKTTVLSGSCRAQSAEVILRSKKQVTQTTYFQHVLAYERQHYATKTFSTSKTRQLVAGLVVASHSEGVVIYHGNYLVHCAKKTFTKPRTQTRLSA